MHPNPFIARNDARDRAERIRRDSAIRRAIWTLPRASFRHRIATSIHRVARWTDDCSETDAFRPRRGAGPSPELGPLR